MKIEQFEDKALAHYSYAILSDSAKEIALIDPARDLTPYLKFAEANGAKITTVIETHPHADFISGHLELHNTLGATIYCSKLLAADYPHRFFDDGDIIQLGDFNLKALNTPGHSPDSISVVLEKDGKDLAIFTGDTLFIGDCGRPDLRESAGNITAKREELAKEMYHSLRTKLLSLADNVLVYPAHGAGTLCGKALSDANSSTIGAEKISNWSLQEMSEADFIATLTEDQPFVPKYFPYDVNINKTGAENLLQSIDRVEVINQLSQLDLSITVVDTRTAEIFQKGHLPNSINIIAGGKFETWLGSIVSPEERFYLGAESKDAMNELLLRCAKIGYENSIGGALVLGGGSEISDIFNLGQFRANPSGYTIVDIRNYAEIKDRKIFENSIAIPLPELRQRVNEVPIDMPIVVHCAGGYRSAAGSSILKNAFPNTKVYDLSTAINEF